MKAAAFPLHFAPILNKKVEDLAYRQHSAQIRSSFRRPKVALVFRPTN